MANELFEGEIIDETGEEIIELYNSLTEDKVAKCYWRSRDGRLIKVSDLNTNHLRNIALFLMGMGYTTCIAPELKRISWLSVLRIEWERRKIAHENKEWTVSDNQMNEDRRRARREPVWEIGDGREWEGESE